LDIAWGAGLGVGETSEMTEGVGIVRVGKASLGSWVDALVGGGLVIQGLY